MDGRRLRRRARRIYLAARRVGSSLLIERRRGLETAREVDLEALGLASDDRVRYEPSNWLDLRRILHQNEVGESDVFLDLGSGKGRVLLQAARYRFKRIIGVELSRELNAIAAANVEAARRGLRCPNVELVTADAGSYEIPTDVTVVYIYNPFRGELFDAVLERLVESLDRAPRRVRLIYRTPLEEERLLRIGRFRPIRRARGFRPGRAWSEKMSIRMYESVDAGDSPPA